MTTPTPRTSHPYRMYDAITSQPDAIASVIDSQRELCAEVGRTLASKRRIHVVGIGTSWHAALVGASMLTDGPEAFAHNSFEFCTATPSVTADDGVIVVSHRGTKRSSYDALDLAVASGGYTVAITSTDPGPRIQVADVGIRTVEQETSSAFTISYTTALTALAMLNLAMADTLNDADNGLADLPGSIAAILDREDDVKAVVAEHRTSAGSSLPPGEATPPTPTRSRSRSRRPAAPTARVFRSSNCSTGPSARWTPTACSPSSPPLEMTVAVPEI